MDMELRTCVICNNTLTSPDWAGWNLCDNTKCQDEWAKRVKKAKNIRLATKAKVKK